MRCTTKVVFAGKLAAALEQWRSLRQHAGGCLNQRLPVKALPRVLNIFCKASIPRTRWKSVFPAAQLFSSVHLSVDFFFFFFWWVKNVVFSFILAYWRFDFHRYWSFCMVLNVDVHNQDSSMFESGFSQWVKWLRCVELNSFWAIRERERVLIPPLAGWFSPGLPL